jgi:hypothetical protein
VTFDGPVDAVSGETAGSAQNGVSVTNIDGSFIVTGFEQTGHNVSTRIAASGGNWPGG